LNISGRYQSGRTLYHVETNYTYRKTDNTLSLDGQHFIFRPTDEEHIAYQVEIKSSRTVSCRN